MAAVERHAGNGADKSGELDYTLRLPVAMMANNRMANLKGFLSKKISASKASERIRDYYVGTLDTVVSDPP